MSNEDGEKGGKEKKNNVLPLWGNERTMNLNPLILTNIQSSHYFKVNLYELKTYHEVIDEIYYKVIHLEPWEKGSRKTAGQTGMCGGVRGVGAGGIVSTAYCLLYKLFTLKLTRKQVNGLLTHPDSPYIRALGFMYIRYTQPPADLWDWYDEYLEDPEEMDVKAGGGQVMTIGDILRHFLSKLEWFSTLFPRIPVPIQQKLARQLGARFPPTLPAPGAAAVPPQPLLPPQRIRGQGPAPRESREKPAPHIPDEDMNFGEAERVARLRRSDGEGRSPSLGSGRSPRDSPSDSRHKGEKRSSRHSSPHAPRKHHRGHDGEPSPPKSRHSSPPPPRSRQRETEPSPPPRSRHRGHDEHRSSRHERRGEERHDGEYRHDSSRSDRYERDGGEYRQPQQEDSRHHSRERGGGERHERGGEGEKHKKSNGHSKGEKGGHHRSHRNDDQSSSSRHGHRSSSKDFASELAREKERQKKERDRSRSSPQPLE